MKDAETEPGVDGPDRRLTLSRVTLAVFMLIVGGALVGAGVFIGRLPAALPEAAPSNQAVSKVDRAPSRTNQWHSHPGPWGDLVCIPIQIEPPPEFIPAGWDKHLDTQWFFENLPAGDVEALFRRVGLRPDQLAALLDRSRWTTEGNVICITVPDEVVLHLAPDVRTRLYAVLARSARNSGQHLPYMFRPEMLADRFAHSHVRPAVVDQTTELFYTRGNRTLLSDTYAVLNGLTNPSERIDYLKALYRVRTMLVELRVEPGMDTSAICAYWDRGGRAKDVRPLIESLARVPRGGVLDITHLIPPFARRRLYTFEFPRGGKPTVKMDCHWTTFNFFNETPEDRFADSAEMSRLIRNEYYMISGDYQLGDVVLFTRPSGDVVHSAVYIADGILFTRNGSEPLIPWILATTADTLETYEAFQPDGAAVNVTYWRKNGL